MPSPDAPTQGRAPNTAPFTEGKNVVPFPLTERAVEAAIRRQAFALDPPELAAFARVLVLALTPERPVRAADVIGDLPSPGFAKRNVEDALSSLKKRGLMSHTRAVGYVPTAKALDPSTYVQRDPQSAAGCGSIGDQGHNAEPPCDPDEKPADPLAAVKAYEAAARVSLRSRQWEEKHVHAFYWARPDATVGELRQALAWIIPNWKPVLKGREFADLWKDECDDEGFLTRRRTAPPATPDPKCLGQHADLFWKAWDAHQQAERSRAEDQRRREQEAIERAERDAAELAAAQAVGLTVPGWRLQKAEAEARERERKLWAQREQNPTLLYLMAASAAHREREATAARLSPKRKPFDPSTYVQRTVQSAAGCTVVPSQALAQEENIVLSPLPDWDASLPEPSPLQPVAPRFEEGDEE